MLNCFLYCFLTEKELNSFSKIQQVTHAGFSVPESAFQSKRVLEKGSTGCITKLGLGYKEKHILGAELASHCSELGCTGPFLWVFRCAVSHSSELVLWFQKQNLVQLIYPAAMLVNTLTFTSVQRACVFS